QPAPLEGHAVERPDDARRVLGIFEGDEGDALSGAISPARHVHADDRRQVRDEQLQVALARLARDITDKDMRCVAPGRLRRPQPVILAARLAPGNAELAAQERRQADRDELGDISLRSGDTSDKAFSVTFGEKGVHGAYVPATGRQGSGFGGRLRPSVRASRVLILGCGTRDVRPWL